MLRQLKYVLLGAFQSAKQNSKFWSAAWTTWWRQGLQGDLDDEEEEEDDEDVEDDEDDEDDENVVEDVEDDEDDEDDDDIEDDEDENVEQPHYLLGGHQSAFPPLWSLPPFLWPSQSVFPFIRFPFYPISLFCHYNHCHLSL